MADNPKSEKKAEVQKKKKPADKSKTLLFRFARNLGRTARAIKAGSTWFLRKSGSAVPKAARKKIVAEEEEAVAGITADVEAAVREVSEEAVPDDEEQAAEEVTADVEAALKAAEEAAEE